MGDDKTVRVIITMRVKCAKCGLDEHETSELDLPRDKAQALEELVPGKCPDCGAPVRLHIEGWQLVQ